MGEFAVNTFGNIDIRINNAGVNQPMKAIRTALVNDAVNYEVHDEALPRKTR